MKKRKGVKRKNNSSNRNLTKKSRKRFFNDKVLIALVIVAFLVFAFLLGFVNNGNATGQVITGQASENGMSCVINTDCISGCCYNGACDSATLCYGGGEGEKGSNFLSNFFKGWETGDVDKTIAKYLLWATLLLFITSVLNFIGFPEKGFLQFLLGLVSSFLAVAYLTPKEIYTILISWDTLGLTLGVFLPFLILIFTTSMLLSPEKIKNLNVGRVVATIVLWAVWSCFLIYRLVAELIKDKWDWSIFAQGGKIVYLVIVGLSILAVIKWKAVLKIIGEIGVQVRKLKSQITREEATEGIKTTHALAAAIDKTAGENI